jgi:hypothetical protein
MELPSLVQLPLAPVAGRPPRRSGVWKRTLEELPNTATVAESRAMLVDSVVAGLEALPRRTILADDREAESFILHKTPLSRFAERVVDASRGALSDPQLVVDAVRSAYEAMRDKDPQQLIDMLRNAAAQVEGVERWASVGAWDDEWVPIRPPISPRADRRRTRRPPVSPRDRRARPPTAHDFSIGANVPAPLIIVIGMLYVVVGLMMFSAALLGVPPV